MQSVSEFKADIRAQMAQREANFNAHTAELEAAIRDSDASLNALNEELQVLIDEANLRDAAFD